MSEQEIDLLVTVYDWLLRLPEVAPNQPKADGQEKETCNDSDVSTKSQCLPT